VRTAEPVAERKPAGLFDALGELSGAGVDLAHNTVRLAACEARVIVRKLAMRVGLFFGFLVVATVGLLLMLQGVASLLEMAGLPAWGAYLLVGAVTLGAGALLAVRMLKKLGDKDLAFPGTLAELDIDREYLGRRHRNELGEGS
jgi:uncharacterized membrane protein YqjE